MVQLFNFLLISFFSFTIKANTVVYFFEYRMPDGSIYSFDQGGRFYHAALKFQNKILEAHPFYGVHLAEDINKVGHLVAILKSNKTVKNFEAKVQAEIGKKFNLYSEWTDPSTTQCSKLVGQIIGVSPILFDDNKLTLSPDTLYKQLLKMGFRDCQSCLLHP
jgi:hypothetical protein